MSFASAWAWSCKCSRWDGVRRTLNCVKYSIGLSPKFDSHASSSSLEADADTDFVLVDLPRDAEVLEPLGERRPATFAVVVDVGIEDVGRRVGVLLVADRAGPQVERLGVVPVSAEQKCWSQIVKASASA